tara:strand:- start:1324 stop:1848 length:525 start_codon:yes stop_codon:yes gene_type:complete
MYYNKMTIWDFDENKNYIKVGNYKVLNAPDAHKTSKLLEDINILINKAFTSIRLNEILTDELYILLNTPFFLQEMQLIKDQGSIKFEGLNKPKLVKKTYKKAVGKDGNLRASYRLIFLTLRTESGKIKTINRLKRLIAHELTHTALNHVTWRDDNHSFNFNYYNKLILKHLLLK